MSITLDKVYITAAVSIGLWFLTQWIKMLVNYSQKRAERNNLIRALYSEVDFNTKDLYIFSKNSADLSVLEKKMRQDKTLVPHITDAHHTLIYKSNILNLHYISTPLIAQLVQFYGLLDKIKEQINGLNQHSFSTVTPRGKHLTLKRILDSVEEAERIGGKILVNFTESYPKLNLTRQHRAIRDTKQR